MNHDSDKEMDLLLRRFTRRSPSGLASAKGANAELEGARAGASHMDADELSAYAEGALPDASRTRYASHLAGCDSCRKIVTELVLSSSIEEVESGSVAQTVDAPARSWRTWLAALFSPPVLRYAAPALALVAFASIVFVVVVRNREIPSLVAQKEPGQQQQPANTSVAERTDENEATTTGTSDTTEGNRSAISNTNASSVASPSNAPESLAQSKDANTSTSTVQTDGISPAAAPKTTDVSGNELPPPSAQSAETKQPAQPVQSSPPNDKFMDRAKEKDDASLAGQKRRESSESATGGTATAGPTGGRASRGTGTANRGALGASTETSNEERQRNQAAKSAPATSARARRDVEGADEDSTSATRDVAGKRFRQQNGVWVDTSYSSSRSLVKVRRGSEQFRALVADEPVIRTVSNSLGGAVIVVVKGRAYHIY
jgi:hypothetical protein